MEAERKDWDSLPEKCQRVWEVGATGSVTGVGIAVDDGADAAEVVAEVDQGSVGDRAVGGCPADYPAGGGQGAVEGQDRRS